MAISEYSEAQFSDIINSYLTPSDFIRDKERLLGRDKELKQIRRAIALTGRHILIYGDRGVGKSSLALTSAHQHNYSGEEPIYIPCGSNDTFASVIHKLGLKTIPIEKRYEDRTSVSKSASAGLFGAQAASSRSGEVVFDMEPPKTLSDAFDIVRYVATKRKAPTVVIIDELERIRSSEERAKFAEFLKSLSSVGDDVKFILCGIQVTVNELLEFHESAGRNIETVEVQPLGYDYRSQIVADVCAVFGLDLTLDMKRRIQQICDGYPYFAHLIGKSLMWRVFDDPVEVDMIGAEHFNDAVDDALKSAEPELKRLYEKATLKAKLAEEYEEALWALADSSEDRRQVKKIYDPSYLRIMSKRHSRERMDREQLNRRLLSLRKETHGEVVYGYGSGFYGFREKRFRGYVRLRAEQKGVELGDHLSGSPPPARLN